MKKILSLLLVLCLCMTAVTPALADTADSDAVKSVILAVKQKLAISDDEFVFENYSTDEYGDTVRYHLQWNSRDEDTYGTNYRNIFVSARADGTVESYNLNMSNQSSGRKLPKATKEQAAEAAKQFAAQVAADRAGHVQLVEVTGPETYSHVYHAAFIRMANGLPVVNNGLNITLDADTLEVYSYDASWSDGLTFASPDTAIGSEKALEAYKQNLGYELRYEFVTKNDKQVPILVYNEKYPEVAYIDAATGDATLLPERLYDLSGGGANSKYTMAMTSDAAAEESVRLSEEEQALVDEVAQMLSQEKAEQLARAVPEFALDGLVVDGYRVYKNEDDYMVRISFTSAEEEHYAYKSLTINAKTGEIESFSGSVERTAEEDKKESMTREEGLKIAEEFLKKYYPEKKEQTLPANRLNQEGTSYEWDRVVDGIRADGNGLSVSVDEKTGKITHFSNQWYAGQFPDPTAAADIAGVYDKLLTGENYYLCYVLQAVYDEAVPYRYGSETYTAHLVYMAEKEPRYDAATLEEIDYKGNPVTDKVAPAYNDVAGHYVEPYAAALAQLDIYYPGESLRPDTAVYQDEYLQLLGRVVYGRDSFVDEEYLYSYMVNRGVLTSDEIAPDSFVTRMDAIRYLLNAMSFGESAKIPGIFVHPFADVTEQDAGYAAIAGGLGLVDTATSTFRPSAGITRAETLVVLYRYLAR